ncbi:hypothetical protein SAMN05444149_10880 [Pseudosulfitobacter pseudonitzschiae]|uniref:hypothetical protein n=1 Tax=Pseudosulfitobacter pseudonitzschiae TaxID=1402135 RepID=UPI0009193045|nr:hypothetical protein [Pseudosulfitobacter pseudonitzschiae]SHG01046.1 hypothetical protein SAMN05444149_10880 [Pseudosulfitobacter pseudonitzschiae]
MRDKFTAEQKLIALISLLVFITAITMTLTTHRTAMRCIEAGGNPSAQAHKRCTF